MPANILLTALIFFISATFPADVLANSRFSIFSTEEIVSANGTQTLLGNGFKLVSTKDKIIFNGYDITDLIHYIQYSTYSAPALSILKEIDNKNPEVLRAVRAFNQGRNNKKVISALFFAAAQGHDFEKIKYYVNKGADVNYRSSATWGRKESALGVNLCGRDDNISEYLKTKGAKIIREESSILLDRCRNNVKELNFLRTQNIDWNQPYSVRGNLISTMLFEGRVNSEILQNFLKAGAVISGEGFYGALVNNSPYDDIISILSTNKSLAYTPIMYNKKKYNPFFVSGYTYVETPIYPLTCVLDFDWSIYKSQKCKKDGTRCLDFIKNKKLILEALLDEGAKPLNQKEESKINKIRTMIK